MDKKKLILFFIWTPIILLVLLNLITVFTPEIGFDALWYHLTLPKLWLFKHQWHFSGGLLYYSVMPRLTETIYIPLIKFTSYIGPKLVQYLSALGIGLVIWKITSKLNLSFFMKSLAVSLFYCTWLVSWESGSAYIDLFRTFLEIAALYFLLFKSQKLGGVFLGLAIGTKWLSLGSLAIYTLVFGSGLLLPALLVASPWFLIAYHFTGNPVYPMFAPILQNSLASIGQIIKNFLLLPFVVTIPFDDFFSPMLFLLVIFSTLTLFSRHKQIRQISLVGILGAIFSVALNPPSSRYLLPFFPALIISSVYLASFLKVNLQKIFLSLTVISAFLILFLRLFATAKYLPFILGKEDQNAFLTQYSSRLPDTFIDSDSFVQKNLSPNSKILIDKLHNLYYFPYNFDHTSWAATDSGYDYLITKDTPPDSIHGQLLHTNTVGIQVYKLTL
jgi:hypothetical protein